MTESEDYLRVEGYGSSTVRPSSPKVVEASGVLGWRGHAPLPVETGVRFGSASALDGGKKTERKWWKSAKKPREIRVMPEWERVSVG